MTVAKTFYSRRRRNQEKKENK